jgi:hypothetical protein
MAIDTSIRNVFGHFQNLNLLVLLENLRSGRTAQRAWSSGALLCPVAHGLPAGQQVRDLRILGQAAEWGQDCDYAARCLGADPAAVLRFVRLWDEHVRAPGWLLRKLSELWEERLADAWAVQEMLQETCDVRDADREHSCEPVPKESLNSLLPRFSDTMIFKGPPPRS